MTVPPQLAALQAFVGQTWSSGPPPSFIRQWLSEIAAAWPNVPGLAAYCNSAAKEPGYWSACGFGAGYAMTKAGIQPIFGADDLHRILWAEAWLDFGTPVPVEQAQPGDIAVYDFGGGDHHVTVVQENPGNGTLICLGSNQGHQVKASTFSNSNVQGIRRPPAPLIAASNPHSEIKIGATGATVLELQGLLGIQQSGTFDGSTDAAVRVYQASRGLDVDGEVGPDTWAALLGHAPAMPPSAASAGSLPSDIVAKIISIARNSPARTGWSNGSMPVGCVNGLAVSYGMAYRDLKAGTSAALAMAKPLGGVSTDALAWYGVTASNPVSLLRADFQLLFGSCMRESSGNYSEGRDISADNVTADTAEAGLFQQSWNSRVASPELPKLLAQWRSSTNDGLLSIFREGATDKQTPDYGSGDGALFQHLCKSKPLFAIYCAAVGQRVIRAHWGPINRHEAQMRPEVAPLLQQVEQIVDAMPAPQKPIDGEVIHPSQPPALSAITPLLSLVGMLLTSLLENSKMTSPTSDIGAKITADIPKLISFFQDPIVQKLLSGGAVTLQELLSLPAELRQILTGQPSPPLALPPSTSTTPDAAKPDASPLMASIDKIMLKLSGGGLAASILAMLPADGLGAPFNWGSAPSTSGTAAVVIPAASGILSAVGGWSGLIKLGAKIFALIPK